MSESRSHFLPFVELTVSVFVWVLFSTLQVQNLWTRWSLMNHCFLTRQVMMKRSQDSISKGEVHSKIRHPRKYSQAREEIKRKEKSTCLRFNWNYTWPTNAGDSIAMWVCRIPKRYLRNDIHPSQVQFTFQTELEGQNIWFVLVMMLSMMMMVMMMPMIW